MNLFEKILTHFLEKARAQKNKPTLVNSIPDTYEECKSMVQQYDQEINAAIDSKNQIGIELLIETPSMIASELIENGYNDDDVRR